MNRKELKKRVLSEQGCMKRITNNNLVCKGCVFAYDDSEKLGNTSVCEIYTSKPNKVLLGGDCDEFKAKE